jgi:hypothetical protein
MKLASLLKDATKARKKGTEGPMIPQAAIEAAMSNPELTVHEFTSKDILSLANRD